MTTRRQLLIASATAVIIAPLVSTAQQSGKIYRIGVLRVSEPSEADEAFRQALTALGYIEGRNFVFETRMARGNLERLPALAAELVSLKVDLIVANSGMAVWHALAATRTIPIVMATAGDPVGSGYIASLARPGGNATGVTSMDINLGGKLLEILKDMVPNIAHVGVVKRALGIPVDQFLQNTNKAAGLLNIKLTPMLVRGPEDYAGAFQIAAKARVQALIVSMPAATVADRRQILDLAFTSRLPAIYEQRYWSEAGGLISYGADRVDLRRRAAGYVDKILKGANPADLPVEQPTKFELVINLRTAKLLGITFPPSVLVRATKVVE